MFTAIYYLYNLLQLINYGNCLEIGMVWTASSFLNNVSNDAARQSLASKLTKQGCPCYDKLQQLFAPSTATRNLQISSNTLALNSDEKHVVEEEIANESVPTHLDNDCYTLNLESVSLTVEDTEVKDQTQRARKHLVQDASGKGKKVSKKAYRVSDMTMALKKYTATTRERFSGKQGKSNGTSEQFAQSGGGLLNLDGWHS